jgi:hypothetical protein
MNFLVWDLSCIWSYVNYVTLRGFCFFEVLVILLFWWSIVYCWLLVVGISNCIYGVGYWQVNPTFAFSCVKWNQLFLFEMCIVVWCAWSQSVGLLHSLVWSSWVSKICDFVRSLKSLSHVSYHLLSMLKTLYGIRVVSLSKAKCLSCWMPKCLPC